jgi:MFS family permease
MAMEGTGPADPPAAAARGRLLTRHFVLVSAITFITFFAAFQLFPTAPLQLRRLGAGLGESGWFMGVFTAGSSLGALFTGPLGDRVGQRRMVVGCAIGFGLFLGAYSLLTVRWAFYLLAFPHGVVWSGLLTATMATLGHVLPPTRRADGMSLYGLASPGGLVFGPVVGLFVYQRWGFAPMTWGLASAFVVLGLLSLTLPPDPERQERRSAFQLPGRELLAPCSVFTATALGYGALGSYTAQEALTRRFPPLFGHFPTEAAFLTCMAVGMVAMRLVMARTGFGRDPIRLLPGMLWITVAGLGLLALMPGGLPRHVCSALLYGGGYSMVHTLLNAYVLETTPPGRRGSAFGATMFAFDSGIGLGSFIIGGLIGWGCAHFGPAGYRIGWAAAALLALAAVPLAHGLLRVPSRS